MLCIFKLFFMAENFAAPEAAMVASVKFVQTATPTAKIPLLPISLSANQLSRVMQNNT